MFQVTFQRVKWCVYMKVFLGFLKYKILAKVNLWVQHNMCVKGLAKYEDPTCHRLA